MLGHQEIEDVVHSDVVHSFESAFDACVSSDYETQDDFGALFPDRLTLIPLIGFSICFSASAIACFFVLKLVEEQGHSKNFIIAISLTLRSQGRYECRMGCRSRPIGGTNRVINSLVAAFFVRWGSQLVDVLILQYFEHCRDSDLI